MTVNVAILRERTLKLVALDSRALQPASTVCSDRGLSIERIRNFIEERVVRAPVGRVRLSRLGDEFIRKLITVEAPRDRKMLSAISHIRDIKNIVIG